MSNNVVNLNATAVRSYGKNTFEPKPFEHIYTCKQGEIIPGFATINVNPGSTWKITTSILARLQTSRFPTMARMWIEYMWTYTPMWQLWDHWDEFMGENTESAWISPTTYTVPQIVIPAGVSIKNGSILDHLGWPTKVEDFTASAIKIRNYNWINDQINRDQNIEAPFAPDTGDGSITYSTTGDWTVGNTCYHVNRKADYFSTALPEPQKGPDVLLPLGGYAPVVGNGMALGMTNGETNYATVVQGNQPATMSLNSNVYGKQVQVNSVGGTTNTGIIGVTTDPDKSGLIAELTEAEAGNINDLRENIVKQHIYERDARSGTRIGSMLYARWGVEVDALELGRPRILDMGRFPIEFDQVAQTSGTDANSPQGTLTAYGWTNNRSEQQTFSFKQHGCLMCMVYIRAEHKYQQGINREDMRKERWDFWHPEYAGLGDQPIYEYELYATGGENGTMKNGDIFGYAVRGADYQNFPSLITGQVRSNYDQSLDYVHMADYYEDAPTLSPGFMKESSENLDRTIYVSSEQADPWLVDLVVELEITDQMPLYSIPGIDRI